MIKHKEQRVFIIMNHICLCEFLVSFLNDLFQTEDCIGSSILKNVFDFWIASACSVKIKRWSPIIFLAHTATGFYINI